jgi:hypothetical protein
MIDEEYEDMPSNEQRLDYLDNPHRSVTSIKDFNFKVVLQRKYADEKKTRLGLLQHRSEEDEVS